ncbi:hypothetical protein HHI36_021253 [Cryptolaemus montrouzieri]|uniref:Uncharacterized protein n=1 Tax=Cryptolaemus montrouzieri TaxID=559131 RepID=A0ABD2MX34_9CUCU
MDKIKEHVNVIKAYVTGKDKPVEPIVPTKPNPGIIERIGSWFVDLGKVLIQPFSPIIDWFCSKFRLPFNILKNVGSI